METVTNLKEAVKHWYLTMILGIIFIGVGVWVMRTPVESYVALALLFSFAFLFAGGLEITFAFVNRNRLSNWGWLLAVGIIDLVVGILLVTHPQISLVVLPYFVGFAILFRSISGIGWAIELKKNGVMDWTYILIVSILGFIFSFILLWNPLFAGMTIVFYTAWAFILVGAFYVYLSFRLRKISKME